jgi:hypothetical protein
MRHPPLQDDDAPVNSQPPLRRGLHVRMQIIINMRIAHD